MQPTHKALKHIVIVTALLLSSNAYAHRVWVSAAHTHEGEILKAKLGYGEFPDYEPIAKSRTNIFKPLTLITEHGAQTLVQAGHQNYEYQSAKPVKDGSYLVVGEYQPTFWSKNADGWARQDMTQMQNATYCEQTRMYGKYIANVGHQSATKDIISRPLGHLVEIVPLDNPANVQVGQPFKVQVLYKGEPLVDVPLTATFAGFDTSDRSQSHKVEAQAFSDKTDANGVVNIIPLRQGFWKANVEYKTDFADANVCQKEATYSTLTFEIGGGHH